MKILFTKALFCLALGGVSLSSFSQVKIGDNPKTINTNSLLELESTNKGLVLPRLQLTQTGDPSPLGTHIARDDYIQHRNEKRCEIGYYYNDGSKWIKLATLAEVAAAADGDAWGVSGEDVTGDITRSGDVGIGVSPADGNKLDVSGGKVRIRKP